MIINSTLIYCLIPELREAIQGYKIHHIYASSDYKELFFEMRGKSGDVALYFSTHPVDCRIEIWGKKEIDRYKQSFPVTNLFSFAVDGYIQYIEQLDFDRVIKISGEKTSQFSKGEKFDLTFELTGRNSNAILTRDGGMIIDCLRRIDITQNRFRQIQTGEKYILPPASKKKNPLSINKEEFISLDRTAQPVIDWLRGHLIGIDDLLAQKIAIESGFDLDKIISHQNEDEMEQLWGAFSQTFEKLANHDFKFQIINDPDGKPKTISCVELSFIPEDRKIHCPNLNSAIKSFFSARLGAEKTNRELHKLSSFVNRALEKLHQREKKIEEDLRKSERAEEYKRFGELLMMNKETIKKGQVSVELMDIFDPRNQILEIPLDSKLNTIANAQSYFKKYKKAKDALSTIKKRKEETEQQIIKLTEISKKLAGPAEKINLEEQKQYLIRLGLMRPTRSKAIDKKRKEFSPRRFLTKSGWEILVGKSDRENDYLTFKYANPDDLWFHTQDVPGSHVLLRRKDRKTEPTSSDIRETAQVAAYYSKARKEKRVEVAYTQAKHVRKPKGGKPGLALVQREKSILVEPKLPADNIPKQE
jgi:predicted ribosome quality control (RQC) complex YloA/Tae2 family protein